MLVRPGVWPRWLVWLAGQAFAARFLAVCFVLGRGSLLVGWPAGCLFCCFLGGSVFGVLCLAGLALALACFLVRLGILVFKCFGFLVLRSLGFLSVCWCLPSACVGSPFSLLSAPRPCGFWSGLVSRFSAGLWRFASLSGWFGVSVLGGLLPSVLVSGVPLSCSVPFPVPFLS